MTAARLLRLWATAGALALTPPLTLPAAAQSPPRVVIGVSGGVQSSSPSFSDGFEFESNVERATVGVEFPATSATVGDVSLGVRLWKSVGAGLALSSATRTGSAEVDGRIPHPLFFEQQRSLTGSQGGIKSSEMAVHPHVSFAIPATARLALVLSAGPSVVRLAQDLVTAVTYDEEYPFDAVTFRSASATRTKASALGFNAGVDVRWMFARSVGVGALVRFSRATLDLEVDERDVSVRAGGAYAGIGLRLVF